MSLKKFARAKELFETYLQTHPDDGEILSLLHKSKGVLEKITKLRQMVEKGP